LTVIAPEPDFAAATGAAREEAEMQGSQVIVTGKPGRSAAPGFGAAVDLGVAFIGRPRVTLAPEPPPGSPLNSPAAMALLAPELAREEARAEQKIDGYRYYPVLSVGISYRF
jgi:hypothetical protein